MVSLDLDGDDLTIRFAYSPPLVELTKKLTRRWDKANLCWRINASRIQEVRRAFPGAREAASMASLAPTTHSRAIAPEFGLRIHQQEALHKLGGLARCANLDPPGAGKTRVAIAWADSHRAKKTLVLCPAIVKIFWRREIEVCRPGSIVEILEAKQSRMQELLIHGTAGIRQDAQWVICGYAVLDSRLPELLELGFDCLILDEAALLKSAHTGRQKEGAKPKGSRRGNAALKLAAAIPRVMALTGSPMPNGRPIELLPMLVMLRKVNPDEEFGWKIRFCGGEKVLINEKGVKYHQKKPIYIWDFKKSGHLDDLAAQLATFSVQRRKQDIMKYLPPLEHTVLEVELPDLEPYYQMRESMRRLVKSGDPKARGEALGLLTKMLQWTSEAKCSITLDLLKERLDTPDSKVIVFAEFLAPLHALRQKLLDQSTVLEGSMSDSDRQAVIDRFQTEPGSHVLLCSRRAAGMSVTLTAADTVVFLGLPWTPGDYTQACGRVHRETQTRPTQAISLIAVGTYDEELLEMVYGKARVIELASGRPPLPEGRRIEFEEMLKLLGGAQP